MRYYLDTEFIEDGKTIDLISIALVAEDGREFYAESTEFDIQKANPWVKKNVLPHLWSSHANANDWYRGRVKGGLLNRREIAHDIIEYIYSGDCSPDPMPTPEFWGYYTDYDWVVFCQLFGTMMDLPKGFPMYCRDLKQEADRLAVDLSKLPQENEHNALADARWCRMAHQCLRDRASKLDRIGVG